MILHDYLPSGNGYKVRLLLAQLGIPFRRIEYDTARGETRTPDFLARINPNGRVLVLETDAAGFLAESDAILYCWPTARRSSPTVGWGEPGSCSGCSSIETFSFHRTLELRFRALLTKEGTERFELAST